MPNPTIFYFDLDPVRRSEFIAALEQAGFDVTAPETIQALQKINAILDITLHIVTRDVEANSKNRSVMKGLHKKAEDGKRLKHFLMLAISPSEYLELTCLDYARVFFLLPKVDRATAFVAEVQRILHENESKSAEE